MKEPQGTSELPYHRETIKVFVPRLWHMFWNDDVGRQRWLLAKTRDFSDFAQAFVAGMALYVGALAVVPYTTCGDHWWRWVPSTGLAAGAVAITLVASARWSFTFTWRSMQRLSRFIGVVLMAITAASIADIVTWAHPYGFLEDDQKCVPEVTPFNWPALRPTQPLSPHPPAARQTEAVTSQLHESLLCAGADCSEPCSTACAGVLEPVRRKADAKTRRLK